MSDLASELEAGIGAVRAASRVCRAVQRKLLDAATLEKRDKSPVTVADFASQAVVCARLDGAFPRDRVVGEEDAAQLREDAQAALRSQVVDHVRGEVSGAVDERRVLDWIDHGGAPAAGDRFWTLDPVDGTKGFLRGEQYAVALALIEKGEVVLGILGCPNLAAGSGKGALFAAVRGGPARMLPLWEEGGAGEREIRVSSITSPDQARFCESVESVHSNQGQSAEVARLLGITAEPYRIDSQCKYAVVALGDASVYLRLPTGADYREKIWDHAAGKIVVEAAGGRVTDIAGRALDFSRGKELTLNRGVVATSGAIHDRVLSAIREIIPS